MHYVTACTNRSYNIQSYFNYVGTEFYIAKVLKGMQHLDGETTIQDEYLAKILYPIFALPMNDVELPQYY